MRCVTHSKSLRAETWPRAWDRAVPALGWHRASNTVGPRELPGRVVTMLVPDQASEDPALRGPGGPFKCLPLRHFNALVDFCISQYLLAQAT